MRRVEWTSPEQPGVWDTIRAGIDSLRGLWTSSTLKTTSVKDEKVKTRPAVMKRSKSDEVLTNDVTADTACDYVRFKADCILAELGYAKLFNVANPFPWMEVMTTRFKSNFFEVCPFKKRAQNIGVFLKILVGQGCELHQGPAACQ